MKREMWNDIASKGALLGLLMLAAYVVEQMGMLSGSMGLIVSTGLGRLVVAGLYVWLMYRFAKRAAGRYGDDTLGFTYQQGLLYVVVTAMFAGVVVGFGGYLYIHYAVGYESYVNELVSSMKQVLRASGNVQANMLRTYEEMLKTIAEQPEPSVLGSVFSSVFSYGFWGLLIGLFIASKVKREPRFTEDEE